MFFDTHIERGAMADTPECSICRREIEDDEPRIIVDLQEVDPERGTTYSSEYVIHERCSWAIFDGW